MGFPLNELDGVFAEARAIIVDRCNKGRNDAVPFEYNYIHGHGDKVQEVWERARRIVGAYKKGDKTVTRGDLIDLINEAAIGVVLIDRSNT